MHLLFRFRRDLNNLKSQLRVDKTTKRMRSQYELIKLLQDQMIWAAIHIYFSSMHVNNILIHQCYFIIIFVFSNILS